MQSVETAPAKPTSSRSSPWMILGVVALPGAVQMIIGNVIEPKLMGQELQLHPVTILLSLAFWGLLWGPIGMLLAVPIMAPPMRAETGVKSTIVMCSRPRLSASRRYDSECPFRFATGNRPVRTGGVSGGFPVRDRGRIGRRSHLARIGSTGDPEDLRR